MTLADPACRALSASDSEPATADRTITRIRVRRPFGALAQLLERGLAHDEQVVMLIGHPEVGDERPAAIAKVVATRAAGAFEELHVGCRFSKELAQQLVVRRVRLPALVADLPREPLGHDTEQRRRHE